MFKVKNGIGKPVTLSSFKQNRQESIQLESTERKFNHKSLSRSNLTPPTNLQWDIWWNFKKLFCPKEKCNLYFKLRMNVTVSYDQTFKARFGNSSLNVARSIMAQVQNLYFSTTSLYFIRMTFLSFREIPVNLQASKANL